MSSFGKRVKELRQMKKRTQKEMAQMLKITERNYQGYEYDKVKPSYDILMSLADYFDVSIDYLVGRSDVPERR